jgi:hypothetical protein
MMMISQKEKKHEVDECMKKKKEKKCTTLNPSLFGPLFFPCSNLRSAPIADILSNKSCLVFFSHPTILVPCQNKSCIYLERSQ